MKVRKAVFPAAGLGTRFLPATKAQPKEILPLVDKPMIQYVVEEAVASGLPLGKITPQHLALHGVDLREGFFKFPELGFIHAQERLEVIL